MRRIYYITVITAFLLLAGRVALAESANSSFNQGFERHLRGDLASAVKLYSNAIEIDPAFAMAYQMRGIAQQQLKKYAQAINDFSMVIMFGAPSFKSIGYYNRGIVKNMTGDFAGASPDFSQAIPSSSKPFPGFCFPVCSVLESCSPECFIVAIEDLFPFAFAIHMNFPIIAHNRCNI